MSHFFIYRGRQKCVYIFWVVEGHKNSYIKFEYDCMYKDILYISFLMNKYYTQTQCQSGEN